ncbi:Scr1 family TA system antitoxin-like transcriptional regulator [Actinomadura sp. NPDC000929]|uniref:Scr1 family TA system antitoxin-like transcriptional regulator n=1 Tax=Actinomadura sp. NPDC000929 TaxID=3154517 RepID=UPI003393C374
MGAERLREIGQELRRLRVAAGLSGVGLASRAGVPQSTVSRVETGRRVSDPDVVSRLFGALELGPTESERLALLVRAAYEETAARRVDAGVSFRSGAGVEWAREAELVRAFGAVVLPRLVWTAEFAAVAGAGGDADVWASLARDGARRLVVVVAEAALRTWPGSGEGMVEQLAYLAEASRWAHVRLGVVPEGVMPRVPLHGFAMYDQAAVTVETFTRELTLADAEEVAVYAGVFEEFERAAVFGDEARVLVERAAAELRNALGSIH